MIRYKLRTLLIVLALGPIVVWELAVALDVYRWLKTYPGPDPPYLTGPEPLRLLLPAFGVAIVTVVVLTISVVVRIVRLRRLSN